MHGYCEGMYFFEDTEFISQTFLAATRFLSFFLAGSIFFLNFVTIWRVIGSVVAAIFRC